MPPEHFAPSITQLLRAVFMPGREDCGDGGDSGDSGELIAWCIPHFDKWSQLMAIWPHASSISFPLAN